MPLSGQQFEAAEENPMPGFRCASRCYHPLYKKGFEMKCAAIKVVRENMGLNNIKLMIKALKTLQKQKGPYT